MTKNHAKAFVAQKGTTRLVFKVQGSGALEFGDLGLGFARSKYPLSACARPKADIWAQCMVLGPCKGFRDIGVYRGYIGTMENNMETTIFYRAWL